MKKIIRILVTKVGLNGHDRGALVLAQAFRDAGFEVIYTGLYNTPEQVAEVAVQEDVDVVAISLLSGAHMTLFPAVKGELEKRGASDILVYGGGFIPEVDKPKLAEKGILGLYGPGTSIRVILDDIRRNVGGQK